MVRTKMRTTEVKIEELLGHSKWVGQLARSLVRDDARAEDITQETWAVAIGSGRPPRKLKPWLAGVVRNLVGSEYRTAANRSARERQASRAEATLAVDEVLSRTEQVRQLDELVHDLPAVQRDVLLLRFFEGFSPKETAKELAIPIATVRSRTARALEVLRQKLDGAYGDRETWHLALLPLTRVSRGGLSWASSIPFLGGARLKLLAVAGSATLLTTTGALVWLEPSAESSVDSEHVHLPAEESLAVIQPVATPPQKDTERREGIALVELAAVPESEQTPGAAAAESLPGPMTPGRITLIGLDGSEHFTASGKGVARLEQGWEWSMRSFDVHNGRFEIELGEAERFELRRLTLDGLPALLEGEKQLMDLEGGPLVLRVVRPPQVQLSVVDEITGMHLRHIELRDTTNGAAGKALIPTMQWNLRLLGETTSPLVLYAVAEESRSETWRYLVRSPGYAWKSIVLDMRTAGAHEVRLERAAALSVELLDLGPHGEAEHIRLFKVDTTDGTKESLVTQARVNLRPLQIFEGLPSGDYRVRLEIGSNENRRHTIAEEHVVLRPGEDRHVSLDPEPLEMPDMVQLGGVVTVPAEWGASDFTIYAELLDVALGKNRSEHTLAAKELVPVANLKDSYRFDFGCLQAGNYQVGLRDSEDILRQLTPWEVKLDVNHPGELHLQAPAPAQVEVSLLGIADTGSYSRLLWSPLGAERGGPSEGQLNMKSGVGGTFKFRAISGWIRLQYLDPEYAFLSEDVYVAPGTNQFTFQLRSK